MVMKIRLVVRNNDVLRFITEQLEKRFERLKVLEERIIYLNGNNIVDVEKYLKNMAIRFEEIL